MSENKINELGYWQGRAKKETCELIKKHHIEMKDDPESLTTEFMKNIIDIDCND